MWEKSNADASDQSKREERGGWIVSTDDGGYKLVEFDEVQSGVEYTPLGIRNGSFGNRPSGTVATLHTHSFERGETIDDAEVISQFLEADPEYDPSDYEISKLAETGAVSYPSEPSESDSASSEDLQAYLIDRDTVYSYDGVHKIEGATDRCGY